MKKIILILLITFSISIFAETPKEVMETMRKAKVGIESASFQCIRMMKPKSQKEYYVDTIYVNAKRDRNAAPLQLKVRIQYQNGNFSTYDGITFKTLLLKENKLLIVDSTQKPSNFITANWLKDAITLLINGEVEGVNYNSPNFKFDENVDSVIFDKKKCLYVGFDYKDLTEQPALGFPKILNIRSDLLIGKEDRLLRRLHSEVIFADSSKQIDDYFFLDVRPNLPIADNLFDIQPLDDSTAIEFYKPQEPVKPLETGIDAPAFTLVDEGGKEVRLSDYKGKVVIADFWGTWCKWCLKTMPALNKIYEKFNDKNVVVLGISCQEPPIADPVKFMKSKNYNYKCLVQGDEVAKNYHVTGFPTMYVIDKEGKIAKVIIGYAENLEKNLENILNDLIK